MTGFYFYHYKCYCLWAWDEFVRWNCAGLINAIKERSTWPIQAQRWWRWPILSRRVDNPSWITSQSVRARSFTCRSPGADLAGWTKRRQVDLCSNRSPGVDVIAQKKN